MHATISISPRDLLVDLTDGHVSAFVFPVIVTAIWLGVLIGDATGVKFEADNITF
jgi:hypothetical protein